MSSPELEDQVAELLRLLDEAMAFVSDARYGTAAERLDRAVYIARQIAETIVQTTPPTELEFGAVPG